MTYRPVSAAVLGAIAGALLVVSATAFYLPSPGPVVVQFDGVDLSVTYLNGSKPIFGPSHENACNESVPYWLHGGPDCPTYLVGGQTYAFAFLVVWSPGPLPGIWTNWTVNASFSFETNPGTHGWVRTTYSSSSGFYQGGGHLLLSQGEGFGLSLFFTMPTTVKAPASGLWLNATLSVQPTNQTFY